MLLAIGARGKGSGYKERASTACVMLEVGMSEATWQLKEFQRKISELSSLSELEGPQVVTEAGRKTAVLLSFEEYQALKGPRPSLVEVMRSSPFVGMEIDVSREADLEKGQAL